MRLKILSTLCRRFELPTPCLQSVNLVTAMECNRLLLRFIFFAFRAFQPSPRFLLSATVCGLGVHQNVHQL